MSNRGRSLSAVAVACLWVGSIGTSAHAATPKLGDLAAASRFIVHSRVSKVEYKLSDPSPTSQAQIPYTIVTYEVLQTVRGTPSAGTFSLRYIGGPDGRGRFLRASEVPVFQTGDEDILFVRDSGEKGCPLAGCLDGRFRVLNGAVYDGTGMPVQRIASDRVVVGGTVPAELGRFRYPRPTFDALLGNPEVREALRREGLSMAEARQRYEAQAPAMIEMSTLAGGSSAPDRAGHADGQADLAVERAGAAGRPISAASFVAQLSGLAVATAERATPFTGVDPEARIPAPGSRAAAPASIASARTAPARSAADIAEEQALPKDDPSITRRKSP